MPANVVVGTASRFSALHGADPGRCLLSGVLYANVAVLTARCNRSPWSWCSHTRAYAPLCPYPIAPVTLLRCANHVCFPLYGTAVALSYSAQVVGAVPVDEHDQLVDVLVTAAGVYGCTDRGRAALQL